VEVDARAKRGRKRLFISVIACGSIAAALFILFFYRDRLASIREEQGRALVTIANVKTAQIAAWRRRCISDAHVLSANIELGRFLRRVLHKRDGRAELPAWVEQLRSRNDYAAVRLFDASARLRLSSHPASRALAQDASSFAAEAIKQRKIVFEDFHSQDGESIHLGVFAPLFDGGAKPVGAIQFEIDPTRYLYPQLETWPTASRSGETLLVRREGTEVVYLNNELRAQKNTALKLRIPVTTPELPAGQAVAGREGVTEGTDYRGVDVVAAVQAVPDSPWFLITKIDRSEAFSKLRGAIRSFALITILVVILSGCGILLAWSRRESQQYRQLYELEAQRRTLANRYEYLNRYANDIIILLDESGRIVEANERAIEAYAYPGDHLLGSNVRDLRDPSAMADMEGQWRAAETSEGIVFETLHRRADGSAFPVEVSSRLITLDDRQYRQSIIRDISERKRSQEALRRTEASLLQAQAMARLGSWEVASPGTPEETYLWSDEVYRIFGLIKEALEPTRGSFLAAVHPDDRERVEAAMDRIRATGRLYEVEHRIVRPDGAVRYVREHADCIVNAAGKITRMIGTVQDITDYKQLEEQFLQAQKLESLGRLAGGVAHDFNNLLTVINGYSELAFQTLKEGDPLHESITEIRKAGESAAALTRQLLVFSRKQRVQAQQINLNSVVADARKMLQRLVGEDIRLSIRCDPTLGTTVADPGHVQQVIMNLVVNARDAMPNGGTIFLETANVDLDDEYEERHPGVKPGSYVMLAVSDTGIGMTEEVKRRIFEPFFTTKPRGMGTGLGLATVYGIVKQSGGWIWVYSEPGKGTTFKTYLPRVGMTESTESSSGLAPDLEGSATILLVEDQPEVRKLAATVLRSHKYTVIEAAHGEEALMLCKQAPEPIHLLLTDVVLPGLSGPELVQKVKGLYPKIKTLFMSGYTEHVILQNGDIADGIAYIDKPFTAVGLATKVRDVLGKPGAARILVVDDDEGVRNLLRATLVRAGYDVWTARGAEEALALFGSSESFDLVLSDVSMPVIDGHDLARQVAVLCPRTRIILISGSDPGCDDCPYVARCTVIPKPFDLSHVVSLVADSLASSARELKPVGQFV
jgi:PAS domain S-box-containing protein